MLSGDATGLANAYDAYAGKLHAYCWTLLRDHDAAADAVQDTFIVADRCVGQLRDPDRFRPWLYAIARNESLRQLRASARSAPIEEAGDVIDESAADVGRGLEQEQTRTLVWDAAQGLNTGEYEVLELNLRHDLAGADLAAALGVERNHAHSLLSRARAQFEVSLAALLVARTGRESCETLDGMLTGWDGVITVLLRKRINRHIEQCDVCGERKRRELRPALLMSSLPFLLAPAALRGKVLQLVADPSAAAYRQMVVNRAGPFGPNGFVQPLDQPGTSGNSGNSGNQNGPGGDGGDGGSGGGAGTAAAAGVAAAVILESGHGHGGHDRTAHDHGGGGQGGGVPRDAKRKLPKIPKSGVLIILLLLVLISGGTAAVLTLSGKPSPSIDSLPTTSPAVMLTTAPGVVTTSASPSATPTVTVTATPTATPTPTPTPSKAPPRTQSPTPKPTPPPVQTTTASPTPTPTPTPGTLNAPRVAQLTDINGVLVGSFVVSETGGTLSGVTIVSCPSTAGLSCSKKAVRSTEEIDLSAPPGTYGISVPVKIDANNVVLSVTVTVEWPTIN